MNIYERIYEYLISHGIQQKFVAEKMRLDESKNASPDAW